MATDAERNIKMKNTIRTTSIDLANNLSIDHATKTITVSKQLHKASSRYGTDEYKLFEELMTKNQGYQVVVKTQAKRKTLRITFDFMTKYISKHDKNGEKIDIADICISALKKKNLDQLKQLLVQKTVGSGLDLNGDFLCEERHFNALVVANDKFNQALINIDLVPLDILSIDIKDGWDALGEISGKTATEDIINNIFSKFCVGK